VLRETIRETVPFCLDLTTTHDVLLLSTGLNQGPEPDEKRCVPEADGFCSMPSESKESLNIPIRQVPNLGLPVFQRPRNLTARSFDNGVIPWSTLYNWICYWSLDPRIIRAWNLRYLRCASGIGEEVG
jgi:hypothetical protein